MNNVATDVLWEIEAQVSIVSKEWMMNNLPKAKSSRIEELINEKKLDLKAANGTEVPYEGWVEISFKFANL